MKKIGFKKRIALLDFLSNQHKDLSLKGILESYQEVSNYDVGSLIEELDFGHSDEDVLMEEGYLTSIEATLLRYSNDRKETFRVIADNARRSEMISGGIGSKVVIFGGGTVIALLMFSFYHDKVVEYMSGINKMIAVMHKEPLHFFITDYWYGGLVSAILLVLFGIGMKLLLHFTYVNFAKVYYLFFRWQLHEDNFSFLLILQGFTKNNKSILVAMEEIAKSPVNKVWKTFAEESVEILSKGGTINEMVALQSCPLSTDIKVKMKMGEKTEALGEFLILAIEELEIRIKAIPQKIGVLISWAEAVVQIGFVVLVAQFYSAAGL